METFDTSAKIKCLLEMALKGEMTWQTLEFLIAGLTLDFETSKQVNRILLKEFEIHQSICTVKKSNGGKQIIEDVIEVDENQSITEESKSFDIINADEDGIQMIEQRKSTEKEQKKLVSDDKTIVVNEIDISSTNGHEQSESYTYLWS